MVSDFNKSSNTNDIPMSEGDEQYNRWVNELMCNVVGWFDATAGCVAVAVDGD